MIRPCAERGFKGLENDFILISDIEDINAGWWKSVIYVGMSRARFGLHLLLHESLRETYETRLKLYMEEMNEHQGDYTELIL